MNFSEELDVVRRMFDKSLRLTMDINLNYQKEILEAMSYSLFTGGKRIRPVLCLKSYELFADTKDYREVIDHAMAIEMIHTYSLIHDDLPSMDDDDYRRGRKTSHIKFGEALAILAGDGLLNLAFETVLKNLYKKSNLELQLEGLNKIAHYSGIHGMIGGQVIDLHRNIENISDQELIYMYETKTGGLIKASILAGSIIGGASLEELRIMESFARNLGLAYQIRDDILDREEDEKINKLTYLSVFGFEKGKEALNLYTKKALEDLELLDSRNIEFFREMTLELNIRDI